MAAGPLVLALGAGIAEAYFTSPGSGTGINGVGTLRDVTLATAGTPASLLLPGSSSDVVFSVTNPNRYAVSLTAVSFDGPPTPDADHSACTTTDGNPPVTATVPTGDLPLTIPAGVTETVDLPRAAAMDPAATSNCQGATFTVAVTVTVQQ